MAGNGWLNPFRDLSPAHRREVARQRMAATTARQRFERVQAAYRDLLQDARYEALRQELEASLGEQLHQLVETADACARCAPVAARVRTLNEVVSRPLHQLFQDAQRSRIEALPEPVVE